MPTPADGFICRATRQLFTDGELFAERYDAFSMLPLMSYMPEPLDILL